MKVEVQRRAQPQKESPQHSRPAPHAEAEGRKAAPGTRAQTQCAHDFSRIPLHPKTPAAPQAGLKADRGHSQTVRAQTDDEEEVSAPPVVVEALRAAGQPLDTPTRGFMERRFGHDFGRVRVHTEARAGEAASALGARAFTSGHDIVFGAGEYAPRTEPSLRLLSHELTHVVQQRAGVRLAGGVGRVGDAYERQADAAASRIMRGRTAEAALGSAGGKFGTGAPTGEAAGALQLQSAAATPAGP